MHTNDNQESFHWAQASSVWFWHLLGTNELRMPSAGGRVCQAKKQWLVASLGSTANIPVNKTLQTIAVFPWVEEETVNAHCEARGVFPFTFLLLSLNPVMPNDVSIFLLLYNGNRLD